jgi:hypothetical protein
MGFGGGDSNLYQYAFSDPVNLVDPTGMFFNFGVAAVGAVVGGLVNGVYAASQGQDFWRGVGAGALAGGLAGLTLNPFLVGGLIGGANAVLNDEFGITKICDNYWGSVAKAAALGAVGGGLLGQVGAAGVSDDVLKPLAAAIGEAAGGVGINTATSYLALFDEIDGGTP